MTTSSVKAWLATIGLERYAGIFEENEVDEETLRILTDADLAELGLPFGPRKKLLAALGEADAGIASPASMAGERRQLTVMFCDMVGFTEMAATVDPEVLQEVIRTYENTCAGCISRFEGYLFQRVGDGIVAFFGFPLAHEDEAGRAIRAGFDIIKSFSRLEVPDVGFLRVRIGIATGVVVVSDAGQRAAGESMNLAARLQAIAETGTIVVSERVRQLAGGAFDYVDLGKKELKGIGRAQNVFKVISESDAETRFDAHHKADMVPLVGRADELELIMGRWRQSQEGEGHLVVLEGEAGIGKSRILATLRERLTSRNREPLRLQCSPYQLNRALFPFVANFERTLKFSPEDTAESKLDRLEALIVGRYGLSAQEVQLMATLMTIPCVERYGPLNLNARRFKEETIRTLVNLTEAAARQTVSIMLFEDIHWADLTTVEVLDQLAGSIHGMPLLAVVTARPEFARRWESEPNVTWLNVSKLSREQSEVLLSRITGGKPLPAALTEQILANTDGVPLFIEELTKSLLESGALTEGVDEYEYQAGQSGITIPATLRDSLMARLDRNPRVREIAQIGAAIGRDFSYELISAVTPLNRDDLDTSLELFTESGLAFRRGAIPDATYTFKHALIQETAYESVLKRRRQELHATIGAALVEHFPDKVAREPESVALHLSAANLEEQALPYWQRAGELALQRFAMGDAIAHLQKALASVKSLPADPKRDLAELGIRTRLGPTIVALRSWAAPEVKEMLEPALKLARSLGHRASYLPIMHGLWVQTLVAGRLEESLARADQLHAMAIAEDDDDLLIAGYRAAMTSSYWLGDLVSACDYGDKIRKMYDPKRFEHIVKLTNSDPLTADGIYRCQYLWMLGYPEQAIAVSLESHQHAKRCQHPFDHAFALTLGAQVYDFCNKPEQLLVHAKEGEELGRAHGLPLMSEVLAEISKGIVSLRMRLQDSVTQMRQVTQRLADTGQLIWGPYLKAVLAEAIFRDGDPGQALSVIADAIADSEARHEFSHYAEMLRLKGWMLLETGHEDEAEQVLESSVQFARQQQSRSWELRSTMTLAGLLRNRGQASEALERLENIYNWFTEGHATHDLVQARLLIDELKQ